MDVTVGFTSSDVNEILQTHEMVVRGLQEVSETIAPIPHSNSKTRYKMGNNMHDRYKCRLLVIKSTKSI